MSKYQPKSVERTGLKQWINDGQAAGKWPLNYDDYVRMRFTYKMKVAARAKAFGFTARSSIQHWDEVYDKEQAND